MNNVIEFNQESDPLAVCEYGQKFLDKHDDDVAHYEKMSLEALWSVFEGLTLAMNEFYNVSNQPRLTFDGAETARDWLISQGDEISSRRAALFEHTKQRKIRTPKDLEAAQAILLSYAVECGDSPEEVISICEALVGRRPKQS